MDQRAIIDVVCKAGVENLAGEIGALLGQELICSDIQLNLTTKEDLFSDLERHKTALTRMVVEGDHQGDCFLLTRMSAAAILGGTLIMLPEDVIEEAAQSEKLDGELDDAYGEVANIIAGVFTQAFVDKYKKSLRFIKKTVEELTPTKIDAASDEPFPPGNYYVAGCTMKVGDTDLGPLEFVVPAHIFDLEEAPADPAAEAPTEAAEEAAPAATEEEPTPEEEPAAVEEPPAAAEPPAEEKPAAAPKPPFADAKKLTDVVFNATIAQVGEEIGALLGHPLTCDDIQLVMTTKSEFFSDHCIDKSILTHMKVTGDREGLGFMAVQIPDAIVLGGTLIMLPEDQIEEHKGSGTFDGEVEDAYGEVANILSGGLTQTFLDRYPQQLRFIKTEAETVVPTKVDIDSDQPFPEGKYYLASFAIHLEGYELHRILLIFPAEVFDLDDAPAASAETSAAPSGNEQASTTGGSQPSSEPRDGPAPGEWGGAPLPNDETTSQTAQGTTSIPPSGSASSQEGAAAPSGTTETTQSAAEPAGAPVVLVISDQKSDADPFVEILSSAAYESRVLTFQDEVKDLFQQHKILGILLIMAQVGEKGFASAIKLQSAGRPLPPIIFAGPEWTRSAVLRAVKYGAKDILVTPASGDEIQDKVSRHFQKAS